MSIPLKFLFTPPSSFPVLSIRSADTENFMNGYSVFDESEVSGRESACGRCFRRVQSQFSCSCRDFGASIVHKWLVKQGIVQFSPPGIFLTHLKLLTIINIVVLTPLVSNMFETML